MAKSSIFISSFPMDLSAVPLGLMVAFIKNPTQDSFDPALRLPNPPVMQSSTITSNHISKILKASNGTGLELTLAAFASVFFKGETKDVRQLEAKKGNQYLLQNVDDWFERVCKDNLAQTWLERAAMRGRKAYLITGLQTLTDTDIKHNASWTLGTGGGVQAPLLSATGIPLPTPLDPAVNAKYSRGRGNENTSSIPDEKVYGVQYREIKLKRTTLSATSDPRLTSKIWWEAICSERGVSSAGMATDDDEEDLVEVVLQDAVSDTVEADIVTSASAEEIYLY